MLCQGFGGAYFVSVKRVTEKLRIHQDKVQISLDTDTVELKKTALHECGHCGYVLDSTEPELFNELPRLVVEVSHEAKYNLIYIAGYVVRKNNHDSDSTCE